MQEAARLLALTCIVTLCLVAGVQMLQAAPLDGPCALPPGLLDVVSREYPDSHVVSLADFDEGRKSLFQKEYGARCPGLVTIDFYGDGKQTLAIVLGSKTKADLVVAQQDGSTWKIRLLESFEQSRSEDSAVSYPVYLAVEGPGRYNDGYEKKTIRAKHPVIVFAEVKAWVLVYAWTGKQVEKVVIVD